MRLVSERQQLATFGADVEDACHFSDQGESSPSAPLHFAPNLEEDESERSAAVAAPAFFLVSLMRNRDAHLFVKSERQDPRQSVLRTAVVSVRAPVRARRQTCLTEVAECRRSRSSSSSSARKSQSQNITEPLRRYGT